LRLTVDLSEQISGEVPTRGGMSSGQTSDNSGAAADAYLASAPGLVHPAPNRLGRAPPRQQMSQLSSDPTSQVYKGTGQIGSSIMQGSDAVTVAPVPSPSGPVVDSSLVGSMRATGGIPVGLGGPGDLSSLDRRPQQVQPKAKAAPRVV
jgi:hypothetical protein